MRSPKNALALAALLVSAACGSGSPATSTGDGGHGHDASSGHTSSSTKRDTNDAGGAETPLAIPAGCSGQLPPPSTLECTGLYADFASGTLAPQVRPYAPAVPLWADGSGKNRWIYLPPGQTIDTTDPSEWTFPVGTRVWKEFSRDGVRVETRFFWKMAAGNWAYGTYAWNAAMTSATLSGGSDFTLPDGETYHVPTVGECEACHGGRTDKLMGFEQVSLGLDGATGLTLEALVKEGRLSPAPASTHLTVGDDGTGLAAPPLSWLHINCGVSCHNTNPNATANGAGMVLRLDPTQLDGRSASSFPSILTTVGVPAKTYTGIRIVPGDPSASLLHEFIDQRGTNVVQMPPIASLYVDTADVAAVGQWITAMPHAPFVDAGTDAAKDGAVDAHEDATAHDASSDAAHDGSKHDAESDAKREDAPADGARDARERDGGATDAGDGGDAASDAAKG